jgi:hypothetical protein
MRHAMTPTSLTGAQHGSTGGTLRGRAASSCGALFTLGIVIGDDTINGAGEPPVPMDRPDDSLGDVERYLANAADAAASGSYWVGRGIGTLALVALLVFSAHVAREIRLREKDSGILASVALSAGVVAVALGLLSCSTQFAAVARASEGMDPQVARALLDVSGVTFVLMWLPIATFMTAVATAGKRHSLLPPWHTITTGLLAAVLVASLASMPAGSVGFVGVVLGFVWFVATSAVLTRRGT